MGLVNCLDDILLMVLVPSVGDSRKVIELLNKRDRVAYVEFSKRSGKIFQEQVVDLEKLSEKAEGDSIKVREMMYKNAETIETNAKEVLGAIQGELAKPNLDEEQINVLITKYTSLLMSLLERGRFSSLDSLSSEVYNNLPSSLKGDFPVLVLDNNVLSTLSFVPTSPMAIPAEVFEEFKAWNPLNPDTDISYKRASLLIKELQRRNSIFPPTPMSIDHIKNLFNLNPKRLALKAVLDNFQLINTGQKPLNHEEYARKILNIGVKEFGLDPTVIKDEINERLSLIMKKYLKVLLPFVQETARRSREPPSTFLKNHQFDDQLFNKFSGLSDEKMFRSILEEIGKGKMNNVIFITQDDDFFQIKKVISLLDKKKYPDLSKINIVYQDPKIVYDLK